MVNPYLEEIFAGRMNPEQFARIILERPGILDPFTLHDYELCLELCHALRKPHPEYTWEHVFEENSSWAQAYPFLVSSYKQATGLDRYSQLYRGKDNSKTHAQLLEWRAQREAEECTQEIERCLEYFIQLGRRHPEWQEIIDDICYGVVGKRHFTSTQPQKIKRAPLSQFIKERIRSA